MIDSSDGGSRLDRRVLDRTFDALAHARRRPPFGGRESTGAPSVGEAELPGRETVAVSTGRVHVPKPDGAGFVAYDSDRDSIGWTSDIGVASSVLDEPLARGGTA
ncbi:hypothetical protein [Halobaculum sp. MBLA0143]|uniref:hypothetical protein n=1 Tax=Halobaculum sp. MBLA0143 TaxID=3079933 RepID=UPI00352345B9